MLPRTSHGVFSPGGPRRAADRSCRHRATLHAAAVFSPAPRRRGADRSCRKGVDRSSVVAQCALSIHPVLDKVLLFIVGPMSCKFCGSLLQAVCHTWHDVFSRVGKQGDHLCHQCEARARARSAAMLREAREKLGVGLEDLCSLRKQPSEGMQLAVRIALLLTNQTLGSVVSEDWWYVARPALHDGLLLRLRWVSSSIGKVVRIVRSCEESAALLVLISKFQHQYSRKAISLDASLPRQTRQPRRNLLGIKAVGLWEFACAVAEVCRCSNLLITCSPSSVNST